MRNDIFPTLFADAIPDHLEADARALLENLTTGKPLDPDTASRVRARAGRIVAELQQLFGFLPVPAEVVREV